MKKIVAEQFLVYDRLGWYGRLRFRDELNASLIPQDEISIQRLLEFEKMLIEKSLSIRQIDRTLRCAFEWYYHESLVDYPHDRRAEMLQLALIFLVRCFKLHYAYGSLLMGIIQSADKLNIPAETTACIRPDIFRLEVAQAIADLDQDWSRWNPGFEKKALALVGCMAVIAKWASDPQHFAAICREVPRVGLKMTATLLEQCQDFAAFEIYFQRVAMQVKWWDSLKIDVFRTSGSLLDLDRRLVFLESFKNSPRIAGYILDYQAGGLFKKYDPVFFDQIRRAVFGQEVNDTSDDDKFIENQTYFIEDQTARSYLATIWKETYASANVLSGNQLRWEFDRVSEYVPSEMSNLDWTIDNARIRPYLNWGSYQTQEFIRFMDTLSPRLTSLFKVLTLEEMELLFELFPGYLGKEDYTRIVMMPNAWTISMESFEGYDRWTGNYSETVEVARPQGFAPYPFAFERPDLSRAVDLLDHVDKIHAVISPAESAGE
jgi:hypothetical protein